MSRLLACLLFAIGCAPTQAELRRPVDRELAARLGAPVAVATPSAIAPLLAKPLDRDSAVKIALANNARLQAALDELGVAGGELASALGIGPVHVDGAVRWGDGHTEFEVDAIQSVL